MSDYTTQIERILRAGSLDEIREVARTFSAKATGEGGILYSRPVGGVSSEAIALELADRTGLPIINRTPRAQFLSDNAVKEAIDSAARRLFQAQGMTVADAKAAAMDLQFGNARAPATAPTSLDNCLWGEASKDFARSLRGDIKVVASNANIERVFGKVELPEVLSNPNVRTLGGQPVESLKVTFAQGGAEAVLPKVQAQFIEAVPKGLFVSAENAGAAVGKVTVSREFATAMEVKPAQLGKFATTAELATSGLARAPTGTLPAVAVGEAALGAEAAALRGLSPGAARFVKGAGAAGVALMAYDFATTGHQVLQLRAQGNLTGAESASTHWIGRNAGGVLGGFLLGAGYGAVSGSPTGPGAIVTALGGGIAGAWLGEKWAQQKDQDLIYLQRDASGSEWRRDPADPQAKWTRSADTQRVSVTPAEAPGSGAIDVKVAPAAPTGYFGTGTTQAQRYVAGGSLENRLNYQAANASYELGLANPPQPANPFRLPSAPGDRHSLGGGDEWVRNPATGNWSREVVLGYIEHGMKHAISETATPQRAAQLEDQSKLVVAQNAANTPAAIAARYRIAYDQFGWSQLGPIPEAVANAAARPEALLASDGSRYTRAADGGWNTPGTLYGTNAASGNVRAELDATFASQNAGLTQMAEIADYARRNPPPPRDELRQMVSDLYKAAGVARTDVQLDAATAAVRFGHQRDGLTTGFALKLLADPATGRPGTGSAIASFADDGKGDMVLKSVTQADAMRPASPAPGKAVPVETRDPLSSLPLPAASISDGVKQALPGIADRDAATLAFALDRQRIGDGLREINSVARNATGTLLFGVQDPALRTGPVDVGATLAQSPADVRADWRVAAVAQSPTALDAPDQAKARTA